MSNMFVQPVYFGDPLRPLFGQYHPPALSSGASLAVLMCAPWGREDVCAYRSLRWLAQSYARLGLPTLRFDYDGCGNSAGDDLDPGRLNAWVVSTMAAIDQVKALSGVSRVVLVGVRFGALMASLAAKGRDDIQALVAINPVVSGRAYIRELRFIQASSHSATRPEDTHLLENEGSFMDAQTVADVSALDLLKLDQPPAPSVLLLNREDLPVSPKWAQHLRALGATVDEVSVAGYPEMMLPPHKTVLPQALQQVTVEAMRRILQQASGLAQSAPSSRPVAEARPHQQGRVIRDQAMLFGDKRPLFGILSEPLDDSGQAIPLGPRDQLVVLIGEGANRLIGPNRIYLPLAQRWAGMGHRVLRFDMSGIGDSPLEPGQRDNAVYGHLGLEDLTEAIKWLRARFGERDVVLLGLCSGAFRAFQAASHGLPVARVVMINTFVFFWDDNLSDDYPEDMLPSNVAEEVVRYRSSLRNLDKWLSLLSRPAGWLRLAEVARNYLTWNLSKLQRAVFRVLHLPVSKDLHSALMGIARRGIRMDFIFAQSDPGHLYMSEQAAKAQVQLVAKGVMSMDLIPDANHTFSTFQSRQRLMDTLQRLIESD
jgi:pimeloyl-ACP methyl ester carboxylesterase